MILYRFVAATGLSLSDAFAGALVAGSLPVLIAPASSLVYTKTTQRSLVYGSLATVLVFLYSTYLYAAVLLLGAAVAAEWSKPCESLRIRAETPLPTRGAGA